MGIIGNIYWISHCTVYMFFLSILSEFGRNPLRPAHIKREKIELYLLEELSQQYYLEFFFKEELSPPTPQIRSNQHLHSNHLKDSRAKMKTVS